MGNNNSIPQNSKITTTSIAKSNYNATNANEKYEST